MISYSPEGMDLIKVSFKVIYLNIFDRSGKLGVGRPVKRSVVEPVQTIFHNRSRSAGLDSSHEEKNGN
ncbi:hypothetical protein L6452_12650 [Arctium lappa]|uniref:Uncharacterized protein n=1 Tax=Arctium lappa TaxID=4217 RepID=A0ACB9DS93_ARCLA|nr:hypothetical protein L6452_12650 [Arctium lappa]